MQVQYGIRIPKRNTQKLEMVQQRAACYVTNRHQNRSCVSDMLRCLNWRSLQDRRKDAHLFMLYKVDRRLVAIKKDRLISPKRKTRNRFQTISYKTDTRKMSFFQRKVRDWNALPPDIHTGTVLTLRLQGQGVNNVGSVCEVAFNL